MTNPNKVSRYELNTIELVKGFALDMADAEPELLGHCEKALAGDRYAYQQVEWFFLAMNG